jgi:Leucine-rich repeat (LRR) protein
MDDRQVSLIEQTPVLINEELIIRGIDDPKLLELTNSNGGGMGRYLIPLTTSVKLSFSQIIEISGLSNLAMLVKLRLDNNLIERIENLSTLTNLQWLDLSFNRISRIENLQGLSKLLDISLYSNQLTELIGLEACPHLSVISVGRNKLQDFKQIEFMRRFQSLRSLSLDGNPLCELPNYLSHVHSYIPQLQYLEYKIINSSEIATTVETYRSDEISELKEAEAKEARAASAKEEKQKVLITLRQSFLDTIAELGEDLFSDVPHGVTTLSQYAVLKQDTMDRLEYASARLKKEFSAINAARLAILQQFEDIDEKSDAECSIKFRTIADNPTDQTAIDLMSVANSAKEDALANLNNLENVVSEQLKILGEKGAEFFREVDEIVRVFGATLLTCASQDADSFSQGSHPLSSTDIPTTLSSENAAMPDLGPTAELRAALLLSTKEELVITVTGFTDKQSLSRSVRFTRKALGICYGKFDSHSKNERFAESPKHFITKSTL